MAHNVLSGPASGSILHMFSENRNEKRFCNFLALI
jgi:hypothetical protein